MRKASLLPALSAGFGLIRRAPGSVIVWGLVAFALAMIPFLLMLGLMGPQFLTGGTTAASPALILLQPVQMLIGLVSTALIYSGIYRAILRPEDKGFAYLKLGQDEFHFGVTLIVLWILGVIAVIGLVLAFIIPLVIVGMSNSDAGAAVISLLILIAFVALLVPAVRLGMALPMTIAERRIRIFEAWGFTKGYTGSLVAMALLQLLMIIGLYLALVVLVVGLAFATIGSVSFMDEAGLQAFFQNPANLGAIIPAVTVFGVVILVLSFVITPILVAPWARAYQLIAEAKGDKSEVFA